VSAPILPPLLVTSPIEEAQRSWLFGADSGANDFSSTLLRIDSKSAVSSVIGETTFVDVTDVAFLPDGKLFGITFSQLLTIHPRTGAASMVGTGLGVTRANALAADARGRLFLATLDGEFAEVDIVTGRATIIGSYGGGLVSSGDLAFSPDGQLFGTASDGSFNDILVRVDITTGQATVIGDIGFPDVFGLAFGPDGHLYGAAQGDRFSTPLLISIDTITGAGTMIGSIPNANGMFGLAANVRLSPVLGPLRVTGIENPDCLNVPGKWTFCQHRTGFHRPGGGVGGSDDTYAWDVNLIGNLDRGRSIFAVAPGKVVRYAGISPPGGGSGAVLIEHSLDGSPCDEVPLNCWWSGYLHMRDIAVVEGQIVDARTFLGRISNVSPVPIPDHLHLVFYEGENAPGGLISVDASFFRRRR